MTISSDAFAQYFASVPCSEHQLKTWHEREREIFLLRNGRPFRQAHDLGLTLLSVGDSYSGLMFRGVTMRRHFSIAPARLGRNEIARGIEGEVAIKSFLEAGLDLGSNA
jgi:hypothetical protein